MPIQEPGVYWPFKSLLQGAGIVFTETGSSIQIATTGPGPGGGDMLKTEYATNGQPGIVDTAVTAQNLSGIAAHARLADQVPWGGITGAPTVFPSDWGVITNKPSAFPPTAHAPTHITGGSDVIPLVTAAAAGLMTPLSGRATDRYAGDGTFKAPAVSSDPGNEATIGSDSLIYVPPTAADGPVILGTTSAFAKFPSGIPVPRYANHPDRAFTSPGPFDDHFDAATLNPKWTFYSPRPLGGLVNELAGSMLTYGGYSPVSNDNVVYGAFISQPVPNANSFTITFRWEILPQSQNVTSSYGDVFLRLFNNPASTGIELHFINNPSVQYGANVLSMLCGVNAGTSVGLLFPASFPKYLKWVYNQSNGTVAIYQSMNGFSWQVLVTIPSSLSGLNPSVPPTHFWFNALARNSGYTLMHLDWVKFTNP